MPLTAAGAAHMAEMRERRTEARNRNRAEELADRLDDLHFGDLVFTTWKRAGTEASRCGHVISFDPDADRIDVLEVLQGPSRAAMVDATLAEVCEDHHRLPGGHWVTTMMRVGYGDITEVRPAVLTNTRRAIARKFVYAAACRLEVDDNSRRLLGWALTLAFKSREDS